MPLQVPREHRLGVVVRRHLPILGDDPVVNLVAELRPARARGYLRKVDLEAVCHWKSPRAMALIKSNSPAAVRTATRTALHLHDEALRIEALTRLRGVSIPMASAILTALSPRRYAVIDIRVWQLLHALGVVTAKRGGTALNADNWCQFLAIVRRLAHSHQVSPRTVERALFAAHKSFQIGRLYDSVTS